MKTQHTPTPWRTNGVLVMSEKGSTVAKAGQIEHYVENAEFIIRAVNSHEALLKIAKRIATKNWHIESDKCFHCRAVEAIAQAESGSENVSKGK